MKKILLRGMAVILCILFCFPLSLAVYAEESTLNEGWKYDFPPDAASVNIKLDAQTILVGEAAIINSVTYVPLRSFSELCGADSIEWNAKTNTATVKKQNTVINVSDRLHYVEASGRYFYSAEPIKNINNRLFVPIRLLCSVFCVDVSWNSSSRTVELKSTGKALAAAGSFYNSDDLYWLSRIINAEAAGEPLLGKIAVGNVVINRKNSKLYPNTIYGVIFDRKNGTQFSPVALGTIYRTPSEESIIAAKMCLEGYSVSEDILFFMNPAIATNNWIAENRKFAFRIGNHYFFY